MTLVPPKISYLLFSTIFLIACSGSALEGEDKTPQAPVLVNAGTDTSVNEQSTASLSGDAVAQTGPVTFSWSVSPNIAIVHADTSLAAASFVAPVTTSNISYSFTLEAVDEAGNRSSDTVVYTVLPINELPIALIELSQFEGLALNEFPAGIEITLNGSASSDLDGTTNAPGIAAYEWQQTAGQGVLQGISTAGDSLAFVTPILDDDSVLQLSLTVTDQEGGQSTSQVSVMVQSAANTLPIVDAGLDHEVFSGESILLNGQGSTSVGAAKPLAYLWLNDSQTTVQIVNLSQPQTYAIAPLVLTEQLLRFTLQVTDAFANEVEKSITVKVRPQRLQPLNDTGVLQQASDIALFSQHISDYPGQDGQRGADIAFANQTLEKAGRGQQGFDFTRLDAIGDQVDDTSLSWQCVRDNVSGLIWESKTPSTGIDLSSTQHSYSWYQSPDDVEFSGDANGAQTSCSLASCNTSAYVAAINAQGLCNFRDWRLPSHNELLSILHLGRIHSPMIDAEYFPHTANNLSTPLWYWTANNSADGESREIAQNAWAIDFSSGNDNFLNKSTAARIRLVRAGR